MHEAKLSRAKVDADNRRTEEGILRAAISNASFERISRPRWVSPLHIHARSKLYPSRVIQRTTEQTQLFRTVISSVIFQRHCGSETGSSSYFESACGSEAGSRCHFESPMRLRGRIEQPFRAPLRLRARLERPFRAPLRSRASRFERQKALGQAVA